MLSRPVLELYNDLLSQVQISAGDPEFDLKVQIVSKARIELRDALNQPEITSAAPPEAAIQ